MRQTALSLLFLLLALGVASTVQPDGNPTVNEAASDHSPAASNLPNPSHLDSPQVQDKSIDYRASEIRAAILIAGFAIFAWGNFFFSPLPPRLARLRLILLMAAATAAFASYYQFFQFSHARGFATTDNFHYYVGSKYFDELGYFDLYQCSLVALAERGLQLTDAEFDQARDLRSMELRPYNSIKKNGQNCPEHFGAARWRAFGDDVAYFVQHRPEHLRRATWLDHGYHPSPSWTLVGGWVAAMAPATNPKIAHRLARIDRVLVVMAFGLVAWAFGWETTCLVVLIWGTGCLWRYTWVGDAFLRHLWWISAVGGVAALRRGLPFIGGAALTFSALLRLFPGALGLGYVLRAIQRSVSLRELNARYIRFAGGTAVALGGIGILSLMTLAASAYPDFAKKIIEFSSMSITNQMGLQVLTQWIFPENHWAAMGVRVPVLCIFLALFWRALRNTEDWEAAALGACLIPILTAPTNYYYSFFIPVALLASRRPTIGLVLLGAATAWNLNGLAFYQDYDEYRWASAIAIATSFLVLVEVIRDEVRSRFAQENPVVSSTTLRSQGPMSG